MKVLVGLFCIALIPLTFAAKAAENGPFVAVSIKPVQGLVTAIMDGVGEPILIVPAGASPHSFSLRPSDARVLGQANLIFWIGPDVEPFLKSPLEKLTHDARVVRLDRTPGLSLLKARRSGVWEKANYVPTDSRDSEIDPHIWLNPHQAILLANGIAKALSEVDPGRSPTYAGNLQRLTASIAKTVKEANTLLAPVKNVPFVVLHDGFQYFEKAFGLKGLGAIAADDSHPPGPKRLAALKEKIAAMDAVCLFKERQLPSRMVDALAEGTRARIGVLDPLGVEIPMGADFYPALIASLSENLRACLSGDR